MRYQFLRFPGGKQKAVTLSYDDGRRQDLRLADVLNQYGIKCTFNWNGCMPQGEGDTPSLAEVAEHILGYGHEIALHGKLHRAEGTLRPVEGIQDVLNNRLELEQAYGRIIRGMAYPDGGINFCTNNADYESVWHYLKELDIAYARTAGGDNDSFMLPKDWYVWMPTAHHDNPKIFEYIDKFRSIDMDAAAVYCARRPPSLFYLWGIALSSTTRTTGSILKRYVSGWHFARIRGMRRTWRFTTM